VKHVYPKAANVEIFEIDEIDQIFDEIETAENVEFVREISGLYVAKNGLNDAAKIRLILDILAGKVRIVNWTVPQLAALFKISVGPVYEARKGSNAHRPRKSADVLTRTWNAAAPTARLEFAKRVGPEPLFDVAVAAVD
jgi:hypothetical protein